MKDRLLIRNQSQYVPTDYPLIVWCRWWMFQHLQVEYKFLDVPPEELETPFALPKPKAGGESIVFNFTKVVTINSSRSRLLVKAMAETEEVPATTSASKESLTSVLPDHVIGFILVSEPEDADLDCEEVVGPEFLFTCNNFSIILFVGWNCQSRLEGTASRRRRHDWQASERVQHRSPEQS